MYKGGSKKNKLRGRGFDIHLRKTRDKTEPNFLQKNCGPVETGVSSTEKGFNSLKATTEPRSFEFYVWSDEGINLRIDLNSSPSDWTNRFRNEVCASENVYRKESTSLWQDLGCLGGKSSLFDVHNGESKSSPSLKLLKGATEFDQQNKGCGVSMYNSLTPCTMTVNVTENVKENQSTFSGELTVTVADNLKEYESTVSAEVSYGAPNNYISGAESCAKDVSKKILDSDATDTPFIKSIYGSAGTSLSDPGTLEIQNPKPDYEISEDCAMINDSCAMNSVMVCPGTSLSGSLELQVSEVASCHKYASLSLGDNDGFLDLSDPENTLDMEQGGLVDSSKINNDTKGKNLPSLTEEGEVSKFVNGRESSD
ncbi:uncharacterized protein LOC113854543 [Abrus precatorius]|uniref:Uncharacterized protein LOC113854543 n=1 Tax=Abrus precatorius TaxID=3816 RepID=A0A8B8KCC4_ABRPR|nr:uncharacterized protein LOC113854543 [Abrus precatorius]XP_027341376.1 uncharacterized protein LOC113854543 [Abrus precatorius]